MNAPAAKKQTIAELVLELLADGIARSAKEIADGLIERGRLRSQGSILTEMSNLAHHRLIVRTGDRGSYRYRRVDVKP